MFFKTFGFTKHVPKMFNLTNKTLNKNLQKPYVLKLFFTNQMYSTFSSILSKIINYIFFLEYKYLIFNFLTKIKLITNYLSR